MYSGIQGPDLGKHLVHVFSLSGPFSLKAYFFSLAFAKASRISQVAHFGGGEDDGDKGSSPPPYDSCTLSLALAEPQYMTQIGYFLLA